MPSWSKKSRQELFQWIFALRIFWGGVSRYATTPLIVALSPGHSDITRFRPWSPFATGNNLDRAEKIPNVAQITGTVDVFDPRSFIWDPLRGDLPYVQIFMNDGPNPLTCDTQLFSYWFSRNSVVLQDYLVNLINNLRGGHCFWSFRMRRITGGKITAFKLSFWLWHTMVHVPLMFLSEWREILSAPCFAGEKKTWWELASPCCWNRARRLTRFLAACVTRKDLQFGTWTEPSFQRHYRFLPTTSGSRSFEVLISTPSYMSSWSEQWIYTLAFARWSSV